MADQSFFVHLQSLTDFGQELQTQLGGLDSPIDQLSAMSATPVLLGDFTEATDLATSHHAAIAEMSDLLGQVQQAITFAKDITTTVADGYQQADQNAAGSMRVDGGYAPTGTGQTSGQESLWGAIFGNNAAGPQGNQPGGWSGGLSGVVNDVLGSGGTGTGNGSGNGYSDPSSGQGWWT